MQRRRLGRTNLKVSVIGFGGIPIVKVSKEEACKMIRRAAMPLQVAYSRDAFPNRDDVNNVKHAFHMLLSLESRKT